MQENVRILQKYLQKAIRNWKPIVCMHSYNKKKTRKDYLCSCGFCEYLQNGLREKILCSNLFVTQFFFNIERAL